MDPKRSELPSYRFDEPTNGGVGSDAGGGVLNCRADVGGFAANEMMEPPDDSSVVS